MNTQTINNITITTNSTGYVSHITDGTYAITIADDGPVRIKVDGTHFRVSHTYNDSQHLSIEIAPKFMSAINMYLEDPVTAYRMVIQANHGALTAMRNKLTSFVMYGSQGLDKSTAERLNFTYRVIASLFDDSIVKAVESDEFAELPRLAKPSTLRDLIYRLLELHFGHVSPVPPAVDLISAPITGIISGRAPDTLVMWAAEKGLITTEQKDYALSV